MINEKYGFEFLAIGDKYDKVMPGDGAIFEMYGQTCSINIGISNPTEEEVTLLSSGRLDIYLSVIEGIVFVTAKFGDGFIFDMPFNAGLYESFEFKNPEPYGIYALMVAVDNDTNIIKAMRAIGFDAKFSSKLYKFAKKQWEDKIPNYDERLASVYERYSPQDILRCAVAKNVVGVEI